MKEVTTRIKSYFLLFRLHKTHTYNAKHHNKSSFSPFYFYFLCGYSGCGIVDKAQQTFLFKKNCFSSSRFVFACDNFFSRFVVVVAIVGVQCSLL